MANLTDLPRVRLVNEKNAIEAAIELPKISLYAHGIGPRESLIFTSIYLKTAK